MHTIPDHFGRTHGSVPAKIIIYCQWAFCETPIQNSHHIERTQRAVSLGLPPASPYTPLFSLLPPSVVADQTARYSSPTLYYKLSATTSVKSLMWIGASLSERSSFIAHLKWIWHLAQLVTRTSAPLDVASCNRLVWICFET